jgi:L-alanine-DL-glutamate epimerase-like enolase superfamily enzyme
MKIARVEAFVFRAPIVEPVANAFGTMQNRPALFVRVSAIDGAWGWGEVFCNFPQVGAEHRARLIDSIFAPLMEKRDFADAQELRWYLEANTRRMAIQCGEPGSFAQVTGGLETAMWDMAGRRAGVPLWQLLDDTGQGGRRVRVYASGIGPERPAAIARARHAEGYRAFKLKVGFDAARDRTSLAAMRDALGMQAEIMVDANQAWSPEEAPQRIAQLADLKPLWVEEPLAADEIAADWRSVARDAGIALAAGENLRGEAQFRTAIDAGYLRYVQPDVGKWGGLGGCRAVARYAEARGAVFCPHWLGGGIGLAASLHLRAALGEAGYAEVDANPNPLREEVFEFRVVEGWVELARGPGLGVEPNLARLARFAVKV